MPIHHNQKIQINWRAWLPLIAIPVLIFSLSCSPQKDTDGEQPEWFLQVRLFIYEIIITIVLILASFLLRNTFRIKKLNRCLEQQKKEIQIQASSLAKAHKSLLELSQFKEGLTDMIVHDLKSYLAQVVHFSRSPSPDATLIVRDAALQMLNIVNDILEVRKFEEVEMKLDIRPAPLRAVLEEALNSVRFMASEKEILLKDETPEHLAAMMDEHIIRRVLMNLLTNALKHTPHRGVITISAEMTQPGLVHVSVADTGEGIPKESLPLIFDKFQQVKARNSGYIVSTGLGLTFCKLAVASHGGNIGVTSEVGKGSLFWFTLTNAPAGMGDQ